MFLQLFLRECDLSFMIASTCIAVHCSNEELCQTIKAKPSTKSPKIAYIRRKEKAHKHRGKVCFFPNSLYIMTIWVEQCLTMF